MATKKKAKAAKKAPKKKATAKKAAPKKATKKKATAKKAAKKATKKKATAKKAAKKATKKKAAPKKAAKKATKKKAAPKKAAKPKVKRKPNAAFMAPMMPSATLGDVIGAKPMPRTDVTKKIWDYIKKNGLQDKTNKRMINADDKLMKLFGKKQVSMFEMTKLVSKHLSPAK
ncbi:SWIB/MDM2 domain-containing protein [bacterium]|nr:SWIB/MDM2 domain-containing protein [bacterium]